MELPQPTKFYDNLTNQQMKNFIELHSNKLIQTKDIFTTHVQTIIDMYNGIIKDIDNDTVKQNIKVERYNKSIPLINKTLIECCNSIKNVSGDKKKIFKDKLSQEKLNYIQKIQNIMGKI
jgi:hypothetical protein